MAAPAPIKTPFSRESDRRTSTRLMSFVDRRRETPSTLVVTASGDTPTMRARCSCPLESVIQTVIPGASRLPSSGRAVPAVCAEALVAENRTRMASVSQLCFTRMKYPQQEMRQCPRQAGSSDGQSAGATGGGAVVESNFGQHAKVPHDHRMMTRTAPAAVAAVSRKVET